MFILSKIKQQQIFIKHRNMGVGLGKSIINFSSILFFFLLFFLITYAKSLYFYFGQLFAKPDCKTFVQRLTYQWSEMVKNLILFWFIFGGSQNRIPWQWQTSTQFSCWKYLWQHIDGSDGSGRRGFTSIVHIFLLSELSFRSLKEASVLEWLTTCGKFLIS